MNLTFEPLTKVDLEEALLVARRCFPNHENDIRAAYERSLDPEKKYLEERRFLQYYIVKDSEAKKIVAVSGLYNRKEYPEYEAWLGWFCTDPNFRGKGIGRKTLEWTINKARELGYKKFKLYTSTDPNEAIAQNLYEDMGLKVYKSEKRENEEILFRELDL